MNSTSFMLWIPPNVPGCFSLSPLCLSLCRLCLFLSHIYSKTFPNKLNNTIPILAPTPRSLFIFLVSAITPGYIFKPEDVKLEAEDDKNVRFVFVYMVDYDTTMTLCHSWEHFTLDIRENIQRHLEKSRAAR